MSEIVANYPFWFFATLLNLVLAFRLSLGLWFLPRHREVKKAKRLFWTVAVFFPFSGVLFYAAFYRLPKPHRDGGAPVNQAAFYGGGHH